MTVEAAEIPRIVDPSESSTRFSSPRPDQSANVLLQQSESSPPTTAEGDCDEKKVNVAQTDSEPLPRSATVSLDPSSFSNNHLSASDLSPSSLRRSTRACSLKAQEKLKMPGGTAVFDPATLAKPDLNGSMKMENFEENMETCRSGSSNAAERDLSPPVKKAKIDDPSSLDQFDCKFGITVAKDKSDVVYMSDESEVSSLNDEEVADLRETYQKLKESAPTCEQLAERTTMFKQLEAELRNEEAKLALMRKLRSHQQQAAKSAFPESVRKMAASIAQNSNGHAYKPPVAPVSTNHRTQSSKGSSKNSSSSSSMAPANNLSNALTNLTPQQQQLLRNVLNGNNLSPSVAAQAQALLAANGQNSSVLNALQQQNRKNASSPAIQTTAQNALSGNQRAAQARIALSRSLEQQLLQIPVPRTTPPEMHFIPNGNQPDFCYLLGLDLVVQRVLKDKNVTKKSEIEPYMCEECGTDFTPVWKAIGTSENDLHLYCEHCVKMAQKKKLKSDHAALLRKAFQKIVEQKKELEKQIAAGKFDAPIPQPSAVTSSHFASVASSSHTSSSSSGNTHSVNQRKLGSSGQMPSSSSAHLNHRSGTPNTSSKSQKRSAPTSNSNVTNNAMNNAAAMAALLTQANPQLAALNALRQQQQQQQHQQQQQQGQQHSNQLQAQIAAMMSNPLLMNSWNPMSRLGMPNVAMALLAQLVSHSQQSGSGGNAAAPVANMLGMNSTLAAMMNPQILRQFQQSQMQQNLTSKSKK